jgi:hypothetical protein
VKDHGDINIRIDRLVLDGLPVRDRDGPAIRKAVEAELTRLVAAGGLSPGLAAGGAFPGVRAGDMTVPGSSPAKIGKEIARTVYGGIGK